MTRLLTAVALSGKGLALFRRCLAVLCLLDAIQRLTQVTLLYSDLGVLPRYALYGLFPTTYSWSLFLLSGQPGIVALLLLVILGLAARQALGRDSRWARMALWALMLSIQQRNPVLIDAADDLLRLMLFWDIFLPDRPRGQVVSLAALGLQLQLTVTVLATSLLASPQRWMLAAQWGQAVEAVRLPWLGPLIALVVPAIWWRPARRYLLPLVALPLAAQALVLDPVFPLTLAVGLSCLWPDRPADPVTPTSAGAPPGSDGQAPSAGLSDLDRRRPVLAAWVLVCLVGLAWTVLPKADQTLLVVPGQILGLSQNWSRVYPLAEPTRADVILRAAGYPKPIFNLDVLAGRRLRLFSQGLLAEPGLAVPLGQSFAEREGTERSVAVWLKTDHLRTDFSLPRQEVRQLQSVKARPEFKKEETL